MKRIKTMGRIEQERERVPRGLQTRVVHWFEVVQPHCSHVRWIRDERGGGGLNAPLLARCERGADGEICRCSYKSCPKAQRNSKAGGGAGAA